MIQEITQRKKILLSALMLGLFIPGCQCKLFQPQASPSPTPTQSIYDVCTTNQKCNITLWYPFGSKDTETIYQALAKKYSQDAKRQNITITPINKNNFSNYITQLSDKRGTSEAPDIYLVRNDWLNKFEKEKIVPLTDKALHNPSATANDAYNNVKELAEVFSPGFRDDFLEESSLSTPDPQKTSTQSTKLYGLPLFYQGLSLFINKKVFLDYNRANQDAPLSIPATTTPLTWGEFGTMAIKLTKTQEGWLKIPTTTSGDIKISLVPGSILNFGTALGTSKNVFYAADVLTLLMQQEGIQLISEDKTKATFDDKNYLESSASVLAKYVSYAKLWDTYYESSIKAFRDGKVAMIFARSYNVSEVSSNPAVDLALIPLPQLQKEDKNKWITDNFYWALVVSKDCKQPDLAWDFIKYLTSKDNLKQFSLAIQQPTTRIDLVEDLKQEKEYDALYGVFNQQLLYTQGLYKGKPEAVETLWSEAIEEVNKKKNSENILQAARQVMDQAGEKMTQILQDYPPA